MNKFVYASLYYKKSHTTQLLSTQDKREMFRYSGYNNRSYRPFDFILAVLSIGDFRELELRLIIIRKDNAKKELCK